MNGWEETDFCYIPSTSHSLKLSNRNINLKFTNGGEIRDILRMVTSDHWPILITGETVVFHKNKMFPHAH
jgi:hypothetical protein